jgi:hypothetical protein
VKVDAKLGVTLVTDPNTGQTEIVPIEGFTDYKKPESIPAWIWSDARRMAIKQVVEPKSDKVLSAADYQKIDALTLQIAQQTMQAAGQAGGGSGGDSPEDVAAWAAELKATLGRP